MVRNWGNAKKLNEQILEHNRLKPNWEIHDAIQCIDEGNLATMATDVVCIA